MSRNTTARQEIGSFFLRLGADLKKTVETWGTEVKQLVNPKVKLYREWSPEIFQALKEFYGGPRQFTSALQRLSKISAFLSERYFHYNSLDEEQQGQRALCSTLQRLTDIVQNFGNVQPRYRQLIQDCILSVLTRREFELQNVRLDNGLFAPVLRHRVAGVHEYRKILMKIFKMVASTLDCKKLEFSHKNLLVRLLTVCFLKVDSVQRLVLQFVTPHIAHHQNLANNTISIDETNTKISQTHDQNLEKCDKNTAQTQCFSNYGVNGDVNGSSKLSERGTNVYVLLEDLCCKSHNEIDVAKENIFRRQNPTLFMWDYFVNEFDSDIIASVQQEHPHWLRRIFCSGLWVSVFLSQYVDTVKLSMSSQDAKVGHANEIVWKALPCYVFLMRHFITVVRNFMIGLSKRLINLWEMPLPEDEFEEFEMRIDNGQTALRAMLQFVQTSLQNPVMLQIYINIVFSQTNVHDYPNLARSLDWVAGWIRCVAIQCPGNVIPRGCLQIDYLISAMQILLCNEYAIGISHSLSFLNNIIKFLRTEDRVRLWSEAVLDTTPLCKQHWGPDSDAYTVTQFQRLLCNWNTAISSMFAKILVYQSFNVNRRYLPLASDRLLVEVPEKSYKEDYNYDDLQKFTLNVGLQDRLDACLLPLIRQSKYKKGSESYNTISPRIRPYVCRSIKEYKDALISFYATAKSMDGLNELAKLVSLEGIHS